MKDRTELRAWSKKKLRELYALTHRPATSLHRLVESSSEHPLHPTAQSRRTDHLLEVERLAQHPRRHELEEPAELVRARGEHYRAELAKLGSSAHHLSSSGAS